MFGSETVKTLAPEDRKAYIPTDVMSLPQYLDFKRKFNAQVPAENKRIANKNAKLHISQPPLPELELFPMDTVLMISEKAFIVTLDGFRRVSIPKGVFNCPVELSEHWYFSANGAKVYVHPAAPVLAEPVLAEISSETPKETSSLKNLVKAKKA